MPIQNGDTVLIPIGVDTSHRVTVHWSQGLHSRTADYFTLVGKNQSQGGADVAVFVASEWYEGDSGPEEHLCHAATKEGDFYAFKTDGRSQYGQKNKQGQKRFVVYHDESRKPYQHRFLETTLTSLAGDALTKIAGVFGYGNYANIGHLVLEDFVGDYLKSF